MIPVDELPGLVLTASRRDRTRVNAGLPSLDDGPILSPAAMHRRRSCRDYAIRAIALTDVEAVLDVARMLDGRLWPADTAGGALEPLVLALHVEGLIPGVYAPGHEGIVRCGSIVEEPVLQAEFLRAAAILVWRGCLSTDDVACGAHSYRLLLTRAGASAHVSGLHAAERGLAGCLVEGFVPSSLSLSPPHDDSDHLFLIAYALGHHQGGSTPT